ncbi:MAG: 50S ribosomal protein L11 methyltransferase [Candidatus Melainabacteria bacterium]
MSKFQDHSLKIRINPDTYLRFDGTRHVTMQNIHSPEAMTVLYDIMLILYEMVDWITVGDLIAPWPPADQQKILNHLEMLDHARIIVDQHAVGDEDVEVSESGLSQFLGSKIHINVENHHAMLRDHVRMTSYRRAIERAVTPETIAMDLGAGSGVLSFFAARAGAKHIYAIERRPDMVMLAEELARVNHVADQIEFIGKPSSMIKAEDLQPKPDLMIAEILGNGILEENVLEFTLDARDRFLKQGGRMIPWGLDIYFFAYDSGLKQDKMQEVVEVNDLYNLDFSILGEVLCQKTMTRTERYSPMANTAMSEPFCVKKLDFRTLESTVFAEPFDLTMLHKGEVTGFCGYFKAHLDEETILTNSPWAPTTHWTQLTFTLPRPRVVQQGDVLPLELIYDGALRVHLRE